MAVEESKAVQLSLPLPRSLDTRIYIRLSTRAKAIMLSLTTASQDELGSAAPMGSFIYALPNVGLFLSPPLLPLSVGTELMSRIEI